MSRRIQQFAQRVNELHLCCYAVQTPEAFSFRQQQHGNVKQTWQGFKLQAAHHNDDVVSIFQQVVCGLARWTQQRVNSRSRVSIVERISFRGAVPFSHHVLWKARMCESFATKSRCREALIS
eukprot:3334287-Amphidinium_carterae.2